MAAPSDKAGMLQAGEVDMPLLDSEVILYGGYGQVGTRATVACPVCGSATHWNASSMCNNCLKSRVNISEGIPRECIVQRCRGCGRYFDPPNRWVVCDLETKELLAVCLKRIKGLNLVKLIDASFIYTEPHSRRLKVKLTIQKEAFTDVVLQQMLVVELRVHNLHCPNCHKVATKVSWSAVVQLRQRVDHKRTFYLIEQLILRHRAHGQVTQIKEVPEGVDFFFLDKRHAQTLISFITAHVPCRVKKGGERVISEDFKNNAATTRFATAVEIVPLCKDDLVRLPGMCTVVTVQVFFAREHITTTTCANAQVLLHPRQHAALSCIGPLVLVVRVGSALRLVDVQQADASEVVCHTSHVRAYMCMRACVHADVQQADASEMVARMHA